MKKVYFFLLVLLINLQVFPCTNFLVSRGASVDGSTMITYTADSFNLYGELYHWPAAKYPAGAWLDIYEWDTGKFLGKIKQARETYNVVGNMNEYQVVIGETTFGGRSELESNEGIMDYGSLIYVALQRAKTAREAIHIMTSLVEEYGYYSSGESFSIGDPNEVWIMEMIGKGKGKKGAVWVAVKIPDGYVSAHANQARITTFPLNDKENCLYSPDVITFAREMGYYDGADKDFDFSAAYAPLDFGAVRFCDARVWSLFRQCNPSMDKYITYIKGESMDRMPLFIKPENKLSVEDVMGMMRDHYQGTELDMTTGVAAGPYQMPYRWRPLVWEHEGEKYFNERPISTPQTAFSFVSQSRSWLPNEIGGLLWFGVDDTYMTVYVPLYTSMIKMPYNFEVGRASLGKFSWESAFWVFNFVSNSVYPRFNVMVDDVIKVQNELEGSFLANQQSIEEKALQLSKVSKRDAVEFLNNYSNEMAEKTIKRWLELGEHLIVKYVDGIKKNEYHQPVNIGYPTDFRAAIVEVDGDRVRMKRLPIESEGEYKEHIARAEQFLKEKNYLQAKSSFEKALAIRNDADLSRRVAKLDEFIQKLEGMHADTF
jgi:dipeptidase